MTPLGGKGSAEDELIDAQRWADLFSGIPLDVQERTEARSG
jgi:hypothetical protein